MLSGTELLIGVLFILALVVMSIIDIAFTNVNKVSMRRLTDRPKGKALPSLSAMLETRAEVLTSIHVLIQLILVLGTIFVFTAIQQRQWPYAVSVLASVGLVMVLILLFRQLIPRILAMRSPEVVLLRLFPVFKIAHLALKPLSGLLMRAFNYFHHWDREMEPEDEEETSDEEIQAFIDAGQEEGILEHDEGEM